MSRRNLFRNSLSKNLLQMKFMQRTKEKNEKELEEEETRALLDEDYSENARKEGQKYIVDNSYFNCERLIFGRMSFKGMNPEIEKLMQELNENNCDKTVDKSLKNEESAEVSDEEMTKRYSKFVDTKHMNRKRSKYWKQNQRPNKKFKEMNKN